MEIEIKRISIETIKPSSPTPKPLRKHQLSSLDQWSPPIFTPWVYFYETDPEIPNSAKSKQLKESLSDVLSRFYPLAGRLVGNDYVDCNDAGAPFSEAEANCLLSQVLPHPDNNVMAKFLPDYKPEEHQVLCLAVQATYFRRGGVAIGILMSHKVADALSIVTFANAWAAATRPGGSGGAAPLPKFDAAAYFPPLQDTSGLNTTAMLAREDISTTVITLPATLIAALRERYAAPGGARRPSRVEAASAFIWTQFLSATGARPDPSKIYAVIHAMNIRSRVKPPMSEYHIGNIVGVSMAMMEVGDGGVEVVKKFREAVNMANGGHADSPKFDEDILKEMMVIMFFSSLCGLPLYGADFGWGRPVWFGFGRIPTKNLVVLMDTKSGDGIEALINLAKPDMVKFKANLELQMLKSNL